MFIFTFLYIAQMSLYWMGKMTKRFGLSRNSGSKLGSKAIVASVLMAANSVDGFAIVVFLPLSASILRILFGDAPLTGVVATVLRGLCVRIWNKPENKPIKKQMQIKMENGKKKMGAMASAKRDKNQVPYDSRCASALYNAYACTFGLL